MRRTRTIVLVGALACLFVASAARGQGTSPVANQKPQAGATGDTKWEGFYAGAGIGLTPRTVDIGSSVETINQVSGVTVAGRGVVIVPEITNTLPASSPRGTAFVAGVLAGYNHLFDRWLGGVEGGLDFSPGSTSSTFTSTLPATALTPDVPVTFDRSARPTVAWSLRVRVGYLWKDCLVYGTAGVAGAKVKLTASDTWTNVPGGPAAPNPGGVTANLGALGPYVTTVSESHHRVGFTFGAGVERPITSLLNVGVEYRHTSFSSGDYSLANPSIAIKGPLPAGGGAGASALPGATTLSLSEHRITARVTLRLPFRR